MKSIFDQFFKKKAAFLHIPKTGGTYLAQRETDNNPVLNPIIYLGHSYFVSSEEIRNPIYQVPPYDWPNKIISSRKLNKYFVFSTVRNIYDWLVSYAFHAGGWNPKYKNTNHYDFKLAEKGFEYLVRAIADRDDIWPCRKFIFFQLFNDEGKLVSDWINHTDTLDDDLEALSKASNLNYEKMSRQRIGRKAGSTDFRKYYNDQLLYLVEDTWKREIDWLGFNFNGEVSKSSFYREVSKLEAEKVSYIWETDKFKIL